MVAQFLKHNIICSYGVPGELITDSGKNLNGKMIEQLANSSRSNTEIWFPTILKGMV